MTAALVVEQIHEPAAERGLRILAELLLEAAAAIAADRPTLRAMSRDVDVAGPSHETIKRSEWKHELEREEQRL